MNALASAGRTGRDPANQRMLYARTVEVDDALAARLLPLGERCWLSTDTEIAGWGVAWHGATTGSDRFAAMSSQVRRRLERMRTVGDTDAAPPATLASFTFASDRSGSAAILSRTTIRRTRGRAWLTTVGTDPVRPDDCVLPAPRTPAPIERVRYRGTTAAQIAWMDAVDTAARRIRAGQLDKVVLARDRMVSCDAAIDEAMLVQRLRAVFPACHTFRVDGLVGASPELLVRRRGDHLDSVVLAGTAPRGTDAAADAALAATLLRSAKDLAEHTPAVASVCAALEPVTTTLDVERHPSIVRLANVQHLATRITATVDTSLESDLDAVALAGLLHPTAAVGGTPRAAALEAIAELEAIDRDRYAAPVGWTDATGDGEFAIALRCAQVDGRHARLFAGAGIVADSLPEAELEETRLKLRAMQMAFEAV